MARKKIQSTGVSADGVVSTEGEGEAPSRISAAIMRILASARGATEGRRSVTAADLSPPRNGDESKRGEDEGADAASRVEWTLRMMQ